MKYYRLLRKGLREVAEYKVPLYSANAAFYIVLSVFPALILVVGLLPVVGYSESDLLSSIHGLVPAASSSPSSSPSPSVSTRRGSVPVPRW